MKSQFAAIREFIRGAALYSDALCVISKVKSLIEKSFAHASVVGIDRGDWASLVNVEWDATAIAVARVPSTQVVIIGQDGDVAVYGGADQIRMEKIDPDPVTIRNACTVEGLVYACGMKRQAYARTEDGRWLDISAPYPAPKEVAGFEAIQGFSHQEIYAAGWGGEIWEYDGARWLDRGELTSLILTCVCCTPNGDVFVAGQEGLLFRGRHDVWQQIEWDDGFDVDIWDVHWFDDHLYVATISALFRLEENALVRVDFGEANVRTCYNLTSKDGVLWSIGRDDIASFDGSRWQRYD
jgi:hypothetical protein